jgi:hypothetical protein
LVSAAAICVVASASAAAPRMFLSIEVMVGSSPVWVKIKRLID